MADEVNIRFGATIDDLRDKLGQAVNLFRGVSGMDAGVPSLGTANGRWS